MTQHLDGKHVKEQRSRVLTTIGCRKRRERKRRERQRQREKMKHKPIIKRNEQRGK